MLEYENYHCHTAYSNCLTQPDSCMFISDYAKEYRKRGMQCLIMSEHGNRSNVWEQFQIANSPGQTPLLPLAAAECYFVPDRDPELKDGRNFHLILVAKNMEGFYDLNMILSRANTEGFYRKARVDFGLLSSVNPKNLICTTACVGGVLKDTESGEQYVHRLHEIFRENFYLEIQHHPQAIQLATNQKILSLYEKYHYPLIYGTDSHYIRHEDAFLRKELLLSAKINNDYEDEFDLYLPTAEEAYAMLDAQGIFSKARIEEAMENTLLFRTCEGLRFTTEKKIPNSRKDLTKEERIHLYKRLVWDNYRAKAGSPTPNEIEEMRKEVEAVCETDTADYFITMKDIVDRGIELGGILTQTGRGSGVSFCTNYALGFTSINRLRCPVKLFPERFTSKERLASGTLPDLKKSPCVVTRIESSGISGKVLRAFITKRYRKKSAALLITTA